MSERGLTVLRALIDTIGADAIAAVVTQEDPGVKRDFGCEIVSTADSVGIRILRRSEPLPPHSFSVAAGWRFMIHNEPRLVVLHDSLLPQYRGFAPLVSALINGEPDIGVTALWASEQYDSGPIIEQLAVPVTYPLAIQEAIEAVIPLYRRLAVAVTRRLLAGDHVSGSEQDESRATYSIWRDEEDYLIDWSRHAAYVARFIDAVGPPYNGACSYIARRKVRILRAEIERAEYVFELRHPGKVFSISDGIPTVICGDGLIRLLALSDAATGDSLLPWTRLRARFCDEHEPPR